MDEKQTATRWAEIRKVFLAASALDASERDAYLDTVCTEEGLREEVQSLLAAHDASGSLDRLFDEVMAPLQRQGAARSIEGQRVGPYHVLEEVGRGGMGQVYRARDTRLGRDVALKFLPAIHRTDVAAQARFLQEARAASALDHPNICTIYDIGEMDDGQRYIAMAYYDGETLAEKMAAGPLPVDEAIDLVRQVAEGLACAHEAGITHRDIKPSNLIVTRRGTVRILDFGIAKLEGQEGRTRSGARLGTAAYMAPEQVRGEPTDARVDLWALGVVLYEMIAGQHPFQADSETALLYAILEEVPPTVEALRPDTPPVLSSILERLLAKAPADRYQRAEELAEALDRLRHEPEAPAGLQLPPLPTVLTSFVGRTRELDRIERLLGEARLVTLTGPAGTGKTRLALQVAVRKEAAQRVAFVSLASVSDPGLVALTVAQALSITSGAVASPLEHLKRALRGHNLLLVLDNFEQVVAAASVLGELMAACPTLRLLVTSRTALRISGEHEFPVPPLDGWDAAGPDHQAVRPSAAVQLFVERARAVRPDFVLTDENEADVAELCRRLDGLPLAIELAAARVKLFTPRAMLARLEHRFELLKGGPRDLPARHQALREAIAWSYALLNRTHQQLFRQLSVFVGGCALPAIEAVSGASTEQVIDGMTALVDHSLVRQEEDATDEPRFFMLETIRTYGIECLDEAGELNTVRERHARYFCDVAEQAAPELTGAAQTEWFDRLERDHDNLRAALRWTTAPRATEVGMRIGAALWRFWVARGYLLEGRQWLDRLRMAPVDDALVPAHAHVLHGLGTVAHNQGDNREARALLEESLQLWRTRGDEQGMARALNNLAWVACETSDFDRADALAREAETLCRRLGDRRGVAVALNNRGWVANYRGLYRAATTFHQESLDLRRALGDQRGIAFALANLGWAETYHGNYERAAVLLEEALTLAQTVKDEQLCTWINILQAHVARDRGATDRAVALLEKSLAWWTEGSNKSIRAWALGVLAGVYTDRGDPDDRAGKLLRESRTLWEAIGCAWGGAVVAYEEGRRAYARGDVASAHDHYVASWRHRYALEDRRGMAECLEALGITAVAEGDPAWAVQPFAAAHAIRQQIEIPLPLYCRGDNERCLATLRRTLGNEAFENQWNEGKATAPELVVGRMLDS